jgi:WhiB family redox-sensing transcriptional regulator
VTITRGYDVVTQASLDTAATREMIHKRGLIRTPRLRVRIATNMRCEESYAMDWRHRALCRDEDPELFFPIGNTGPAIVQLEQAKAVCRRCPVTDECLSWALESGQDAGIWGGMGEDERRAVKRRGARAARARMA